MPEHKCHNEERLRNLEINEIGFKKDIQNLIDKMDSLADWIKNLIITFIATFGLAALTSFGYLLVKWVEKK